MIHYVVGGFLLLHAGYSSWEFHQLVKYAPETPSIPSDITLEVLIGITVLIFGAITSVKNEPFLSVSGETITPEDPFLKKIEMKSAMNDYEKLGITPFEELDSRVEFIDINKKRREYAEWAQSK